MLINTSDLNTIPTNIEQKIMGCFRRLNVRENDISEAIKVIKNNMI